MSRTKSKQTREGSARTKKAGVISKAKDALTNTVKALAGASAAESSEATAAKAADKPAAKAVKPKTKATSKPKAKAKPKSKAKPKAAAKGGTSKATRKSATRAKRDNAKVEKSTRGSARTDPKVDAPIDSNREAGMLPDNSVNVRPEGENTGPSAPAPAKGDPAPVLREAPKLREQVYPTRPSFRSTSLAARANKPNLVGRPVEGDEGHFQFQFIYNGMKFSARVLGKDARGVILFLEGYLGFVPFSYEGQGLKLQLLEVLQFARKQKMVHINLVAEQRISMTAEILIKGPFNPNTAISAVATRLARVKPLLDVIHSLQPYRPEYADGLSHYVSSRNSQNAA